MSENTCKGIAKDTVGRQEQDRVPVSWVPIREEPLWKPFRRLRVVSIGAGFSGKGPGVYFPINNFLLCKVIGLMLVNKIQWTYNLDNIGERIIYENNVRWYTSSELATRYS